MDIVFSYLITRIKCYEYRVFIDFSFINVMERLKYIK